MKRIDNKGFTLTEFIIMLTAVLILFAIGTKLISDNSKNYTAFKTLANNFASDVSKYKDFYTKPNNVYYLEDLIRKGYSNDLKNPLNGSENCDRYDTYIEVISTNNKKIYMRCGNYILTGIQDKYYDIYEVSEWSETQEEGYTDTAAIYNYEKDGKVMLDEYVSSEAFYEYFYINEGKLLNNLLDEVDNEPNMKLLTKFVYREKTFLKTVK